MQKKIPLKLSFELYSYLRRNDTLRDFCFEFSNQFFTFRKTRGWKDNLEREFIEDDRVSTRDAIICFNCKPIGVQKFSLSLDGKEAYAEGIYVIKEHRGEGIAVMLRDVLLSNLYRKKVKRFYIGAKGERVEHVLNRRESQEFAKKDMLLHARAVIEPEVNQQGRVLSYGFELGRYNYSYDVSKISLDV